jgi:FMN-dependent NADH-azoreductase
MLTEGPVLTAEAHTTVLQLAHSATPDKRVIAAIARGGFYGKDSAMFSAEHAESYIRIVFNFLGCKDIEFVLAEGLSQGEASKAEAIKSAHDAALQFAA